MWSFSRSRDQSRSSDWSRSRYLASTTSIINTSLQRGVNDMNREQSKTMKSKSARSFNSVRSCLIVDKIFTDKRIHRAPDCAITWRNDICLTVALSSPVTLSDTDKLDVL